MRLLELLNAPWAMTPEKLQELQAIYATHCRGEKIDIAALEARLGGPLNNEPSKYKILPGGVAVLPIEGVMAPKANLFMQISGGASTQMLGQQVRAAMADSMVTSMILAIDSPGGSVFGTPELGQIIREASAVKPIVSVAEAIMASAAYWAGSAANAVYITGPTVTVGSIGVLATHNYKPNASGVVTEVSAGKYKRIASTEAPLTKDGQAYLQSQVDHIYSVFVDAVAANRGTGTEAVLERMADGRVFIGQQAIDAGLVDGVSTVESMAEQLATNPTKFKTRHKAVFALGGLPGASAGAQPSPISAGAPPQQLQPPGPVSPSNPPPLKGQNMDRKTLEAEHPALFAALQTEFAAAGVKAEIERVAAVRAQSLPGHEALIDKLAADGTTTGPMAAMAVLAAESALRTAAAQAHLNDAPAAAKNTQAPADTAPTKEQLVAKATAYAAEHKVSMQDALKHFGVK
jgi:capsid assembly protease